MDGQRYVSDDLAEPLPNPLTLGPVPVHDPAGLLGATPTYRTPSPGDIVAYAGFPRAGALAGQAVIGFGSILTDAEATAAIGALAAVGDEEGRIAHDHDAEVVIAGEATLGMSGGGVFDEAGRLVATTRVAGIRRSATSARLNSN
jgi:hypothetical protein